MAGYLDQQPADHVCSSVSPAVTEPCVDSVDSRSSDGEFDALVTKCDTIKTWGRLLPLPRIYPGNKPIAQASVSIYIYLQNLGPSSLQLPLPLLYSTRTAIGGTIGAVHGHTSVYRHRRYNATCVVF